MWDVFPLRTDAHLLSHTCLGTIDNEENKTPSNIVSAMDQLEILPLRANSAFNPVLAEVKRAR